MITCIVSKRLSESPLDDHHALRRFAAQLVAYVCHTYNGTYPVLQQRVTKTLLRAFLDPNKPIGTYYGAIVGLAGLGDQVVGILLRPNVKAFTTNCLEKNKSGSDGGGNVTAVTLTGTEKRDKDLVIELLVDVLHKHILTEYEQTERFVLNKDPASVTRPTLQQLEYEFTDAFGVEYGAKVAGLVDASLSARNSNVSKSQGKKRATVQNDMDVD
ncbi:Transcription initiation factor TFIID subunit 6 [Physocladia obscura]|uniref:Transcription initiation factor TFIID subunit 6 n=1 Tax=Physocladia obscura TaxID=109957 RepID=A0AAD5XGY4_9FUNG|nr:Transcription initiation factor TFIID subunit 6 [Physocladia obscura]